MSEFAEPCLKSVLTYNYPFPSRILWALAPLDRKADVNARDRTGETPLHDTVSRDRREVVLLLLNNKATVNAEDYQGYTPLYLLFRIHREKVAELLRQHGGHE